MCRQPLDSCVQAGRIPAWGLFNTAPQAHTGPIQALMSRFFSSFTSLAFFPRVMKCHKVKSPDGFTLSHATFSHRAIFQRAALEAFPQCLPSCTEFRLQAELRLHVAFTCSHRSAARPDSSWTCSISMALQHCAQGVYWNLIQYNFFFLKQKWIG